MTDLRRLAAHERAGTAYARHLGHIADGVGLMRDGTVFAVVEVAGFPHEMAGDEAANARHAVRAAVLRNIADEDVGLVEHLVRHDDAPPFAGPSPAEHATPYGAELARDYAGACLRGLMTTTWLVTVLVRPTFAARGWRAVLGLEPREEAARPGPALDRRVARLEDRVRALLEALAPLAPRRLGVRVEGGVAFSEIAEAHRLVLYARRARVPMVAPGSLGASIYTERVVCSSACFRVEAVGVPEAARPHGLMLGFRVYPNRWRVGMFDALLALPFRFVLTNSYDFHGRTKAGDRLAVRARRMESVGDRAASLADELDEAIDAIDRGEHVMGSHHWSLAVHADGLAGLEGNAATARSAVADAGAVLAAEDVGMEAAYWAQLPGAPAWLRARAGALPSVAFAAMSSLHAPPRGDARHHWGHPLYRARTTAGTAYDTPWHLRDVGHRLRIGPTGSGKTLHMAFETVMLDPLVRARGGRQIIFDKDGGNEILVRAMGGAVARLRRGEASGAAPLRALPNTEASRAWLHEFLTGLVMDDGRGAPSPEDARRLALGVAFVMRLPVGLRSIAGVREFLGHTDPAGAGARLERWCRGGPLGWAFDGEADLLDFGGAVASVDPTALLADGAVMPPMAAYLLHRAGLVVDGRPTVVHADEFRAYLPDLRTVGGQRQARFDRGFEDFALTGRKLELSLDIATQQPEHILDHPVGPSLVAQCKTRALYRNPDARRGPYMEGLGCTDRVFQAVSRDMLAGPHSVVLMREETSVLLRLDLSHLPGHVAVLSGRAATLRAMAEAVGEHGSDPVRWLPAFRRQLSAAHAA
jgi:type IV secretion system protein VirB4